MQTLYQPHTTPLTVKYQPDEQTELIENPPRFSWMPARLEDERYMLQVATTETFGDARTYSPILMNAFTPPDVFEAGTYFWRYALVDEANHRISDWSQPRRFIVPQGLPQTPLPPRETRLPDALHPRLWLNPSRLYEFRKSLEADQDFCSWQTFYTQSVLPWADRVLIPEPSPYPDNKRVAALWRKMYIDCQEVLYAVRHLSIAGIILQDDRLIEWAKAWLLYVADWDTEGTTSRDYNDEAAFRIAGALAWGYDWLYDLLNDSERQQVRQALIRRTEQVAHHVVIRSKIHHVPYDSHAVRSLSSVLVPCCIALLGDEPRATDWLNYTLEYYATLYTPWGGRDGGWAEGGMYWTTGMAFVTEALNLAKNFTGIDLYQRPFFERTGDFPLYCFSVDTSRASFGDQSNLGEKPILKTGFNIRQFAAVTGNGWYQWYYEKSKENDPDPDSKFYNWGWWDFRFDELMYRFDWDGVEAVAPTDAPPLKWFRDVGWVAFHHAMDKPDDHITLLFKSSPYGSISHSHGDQNAFTLHAYGEPLAIESGYYIAFGSTMHKNWRRQTQSKNGLLIDGQGQYAGDDKLLNIAAKGRIESVEDRGDVLYARGDATAAYRLPNLQKYVREIYFVRRTYFVIVDTVELSQPAPITWQIHALNPFEFKDQKTLLYGGNVDLEVEFLYVSAGNVRLSQTDVFEDVDLSEISGLPCHYHLRAEIPAATNHRVVTLLLPKRKNDVHYVSHFIDDQGHGNNIYIIYDGHTFKV